MKTVSIIIPVYNSGATLARCLNSVLASTYRNMEILLLDDGSKDCSLEICRKYAEKDRRIRVFHHENHGVSYTRNRGLDETTGDYVMFIDSDDTVSPAWVGAYVEAIKGSGADMVIGSMTEIDIYGNSHIKKQTVSGIVGQEIWKYICYGEVDGFGYVPNKIYDRNLIRNLRFNEAMTVQEDMDFAMRAIERARRIFLFQETGYYYYYVPSKRETSYRGILDNQIRMFNNYKVTCAEHDDRLILNMSNRICGLVCLCLKQYTQRDDWKQKYESLRNEIELQRFASLSPEREAWKCRLLLRKQYCFLHAYLATLLYFNKVKRGLQNGIR